MCDERVTERRLDGVCVIKHNIAHACTVRQEWKWKAENERIEKEHKPLRDSYTSFTSIYYNTVHKESELLAEDKASVRSIPFFSTSHIHIIPWLKYFPRSPLSSH